MESVNTVAKIDLRSRRGVAEAVETVYLAPIYYLWVVLVLGFGLWVWSQAANSMAIAYSGRAYAVGQGDAGEIARKRLVVSALGGYAEPYRNAYVQTSGRSVAMGVDTQLVSGLWNRIFTPFGTVNTPVKQGTVVRREDFYPRAPAVVGPGLGRWE